MPERRCTRCGKPIIEPHRTKYCSDACSDSAARERGKIRQAQLRSMPKARRWLRVYPPPAEG